MAYEIQITAPCGMNLYAIVKNQAGQVFNTLTNAFEVVATANWASYVVPLIEAVVGSGIYFGTVPTTLPAVIALIPVLYYATGATPASTDAGQGLILNLDWSGTAVNSLAVIPQGGISSAISIPQIQASPAKAQSIVAQLMAAELDNPGGVAKIVIDGQEAVYLNPKERIAWLEYWKRQVALLGGTRTRVSNVFLGGW